jgi:hypothetical protein
MRSDVVVDFKSQVNSNGSTNKSSVNGAANDIKLSQLSGFIDLVPFSPIRSAAAFGQYVSYSPYDMQEPPKAFVPRFVITDLASDYAQTPAGVLLALATALTISRDSAWKATFKRSIYSDKNAVDLHNIGALNYDVKINPDLPHEAIDIKTDNVSELYAYIGQLVSNNIMISLDCPIGGPQSWYLSLFLEGAGNWAPAINTIINAANSLTNNNFSKIFETKANRNIFTDMGNQVHLGWWTDRTGLKRDIRDFDHLAVCKLTGEKNPGAIKEWSDTFLRPNYPIAVRLSARRKMISDLSNQSAVFTGFAERVTFSSDFLNALNEAIMATGVRVDISSGLPGLDYNDQRYYANFAPSAMINPLNGSFLQNKGGSDPQGNYRNVYYHNYQH